MPQNSKKAVTSTPKKAVAQKTNAAKEPWYKVAREKYKTYLDSRVHRSFRRTYRRDYVKPLVLPGIFNFTWIATKTVWDYKKLFLPLMLIYAVLYTILVGIGSQDTYTQISEAVKTAGADIFGADWGVLGQSVLTLISMTSNSLTGTLTDAQQIFGVLLGLMVWLTTVWLLRNVLAGHAVKMRDGLYNAGAPIVSTMLILFVIVAQLLPIALAAIGYAAAVSSGILAGGVESMLFWMAASLLVILSLYWISSSFLALVIVTLPGMYPLKALKAAGELAMGRRVKLVIRWLWMIFCAIALWAVVMIPTIIFDNWLKSIWLDGSWLPIIPFMLLVLSTYTVFWASTYVYVLYRKVVDND